MKIKKIIIYVFIFIFTFAPSVLPNYSKYVQASTNSNICLNKISDVMVKGSILNLKIKNNSSKVYWSSSNKSIATVTNSGRVKAKNKGIATITAKVNGKKYKCKIAVESPVLNKKSFSILKTQTALLAVNNNSQTINWSSENMEIATVSKEGVISAKKKGITNIVATIDGIKYKCNVKVTDTVDLIIFMGQSNMSGRGNVSQIPNLISGAGYEYKAIMAPNKLSELKEPFGKYEDKYRGINDAGEKCKTGSLVTCFVNNYYHITSTPIIAVSASQGGTSINKWLNYYLIDDAMDRCKKAETYLFNNGIVINHKYMVWYQGENDYATSSSDYKSQLVTLVNKMKTVGVQKCMIIRIGRNESSPYAYDHIMVAQNQLCQENNDFLMISTRAQRFAFTDCMNDDGIHVSQKGLNILGTEAGRNAGRYALIH